MLPLMNLIWVIIGVLLTLVSIKCLNAATDSSSNLIWTKLSNTTCKYAEIRDDFEEKLNLYLNNCSGDDLHNIATKVLKSSSYNLLKLDNFTGQIKQESVAGLSAVTLNISYAFHEGINEIHNTTYLKYFEVKQFELSDAILRPLPLNLIYNITLKNGYSIELGICSYLRILTLQAWDLTYIPEEWLKNCTIRDLTIEHQPKSFQLTGVQLNKVLKNGVSNLETLTIRHCLLETIDRELTGANRLYKLDLSHNQLHYFLINTVLPSLRELDVSHNHLFGSAQLASGITKQPSLSTLCVDENPYFTLCDAEEYAIAPFDEVLRLHQPLKGQYLHLQNLQWASFRQTSTSSLCLSRMTAPNLKYLDLGDSHIDTVQLLGVPSTEQDLTINLSGNPIYRFPFEEEEYDRLKQLGYTLHLTGFNHTVDCDCNSFWIMRAKRDGNLRANVTCQGDGNANLRCEKRDCGQGCVCRQTFNSTETETTCQGISVLPVELIELLQGSNKNVTITKLNLTNNRINRLNSKETDALFGANFERKVFLAGNPVICDCQNEGFIRVLQKNQGQIPDFNHVSCLDESNFVIDVIPFYLCYDKQWFIILISISVSVASAFILCVAAYHRFKKEIKIYLYARGLCLCCVKETELDSEREYDAFISFSHKDEDFVNKNFLPILDRDYKICVHFRDWIAGEMIPNQIVNSVNNSRRTIIILSKNFVESIWGLLEFKTAHVSALKEGRVRLIIVVLDDVIDDPNIDTELKSYLRTNTYIKFGDRWFWKKLFYAMPHFPLEKDSHEVKGVECNGTESENGLSVGLTKKEELI